MISKREVTITVCTVNSFKEKLKKFGSVVVLLNDNKRQQSQYSQKRDICGYYVLPYHGRQTYFCYAVLNILFAI